MPRAPDASPPPPTGDALATYNAKRDFALTAEPAGEIGRATGDTFMMQKHAATRLHWDLRLELDGVLLSWAVTRGPSADPDEKRLAVRTEDHPLSYATFEGVIPKGQYGGGTVMLWDRGTWRPCDDAREGLKAGKLHFVLSGTRMRGEWILVRLKPRPKERGENWLLRKVDDAHAGGPDLVATHVTSVATGRGFAEIAAQADTVWDTRPAGTPAPADMATRPSRARVGKLKALPPPAFRPPMLATLAATPPAGDDWLAEIKYDGYRAQLAIGGGAAKAYTRNGNDWSDTFAGVVAAAARLNVGSALVDGEIVALDAEGNPNFSLLQRAIGRDGRGRGPGQADLQFFAFDLLELDGVDLTELPLTERKARLKPLVADAGAPLHYADDVRGGAAALLKTLCALGYEGLIAKRADSPYLGKRSPAWLKVKCVRHERFAVGGLKRSDNGRGFASLLVGQPDGAGGLTYMGKVGTGFDATTLDALAERLEALRTDASPFGRLDAEARRGASWVRPEIVVELGYAETTADGHLRHARFLKEVPPGAGEPPEAIVGDGANGGGSGAAGKGRKASGGAKATAPPEASDPHASTKSAAKAPPPKIAGGGSPAPGGPSSVPKGEARLLDVRITHPERLVFPEVALSKLGLAEHYAALAAAMLRDAADRPLSLVRCPQGPSQHCFFQKHDAEKKTGGMFDARVRRIAVPGDDEPYLAVDDAAGLVACVQMGTIEFHGWGSRASDIERPDRLVFDLDPDPSVGFDAVRHAAADIRDRLAALGMKTWPLLSGGKGVHVVAPLTPGPEWPVVKAFARGFAARLAAEDPARYTDALAKARRKGRIFVDYLRNQRGATAVMPWSVRARDGAPVAVPVSWRELGQIDRANRFAVGDREELLRRAKATAKWGRAAQDLPAL